MGSVFRVFVLVVAVTGVAALLQPDVMRRVLRDRAPDRAANACRIPLTFHLGDVDERFALDRSQARAALADAVAMWESVTSDAIFKRRPGVGMPISLVFDERQARAQSRQQTQSELADAKKALEDEQAELEEQREALESDWEAFEARRRDHEQRRAEHRARVEAWNNGEIERTPKRRAELDDMSERLREEAESLKARQEELTDRRDDLELKREALQRESDTYNEQAASYNEQAEKVSGFQIGQYEQTGEDRRIHIYKAVGQDELRLVIAHELGHALGIKHVAPAESVMNKKLGQANRGREALSSADRQALAQACDVTLNSR